MCGIAGLFCTDGNRTDRSLILSSVEKMVQSIGHRGPDDHGSVVLEGDNAVAALGNTRLAILDLRPEGHQPMVEVETGNWITYNGEVYNYLELKRELQAYGPWISRTDTEVVLKAYARWGRDCVSHLQGMFAFAIWDKKRNELFIARDRLGIKPLYYYASPNLFAFGSELRAILATGLIQRRIDSKGLWGYLVYQCLPGDRTLVQDVQMLSPGSWMVVNSKGEVIQHRYWTLLGSASADAKEVGKDDGKKRTGELLRESVAYHLASDVPIGVFLSGGVDSSVIVGLMREMGQTPHTFTIVCPGIYDESQFSRIISRQYQTEHNEILITEKDVLGLVCKALDSMDQPTGDGINTFVVSQSVSSSGLKVALSGLGGDEFFGGYPSFSRLRKLADWTWLWKISPGSARSAMAGLLRKSSALLPRANKIADLVASNGTLPSLYLIMRQIFLHSGRQRLLETSQPFEDPYIAALEQSFNENSWAGITSHVSNFEGATYLPDVLLRDTDQMSMASSLEVRVPLLDHKLVEFLLGLSDTNKQPDNGFAKSLMVSGLDEMLPREIMSRPKQGFSLPFKRWMRTNLKDLCETSLTRLADRGIMQPGKIRELWQGFLACRRDVPWANVWILVVLDHWLQQNELTS